MIDRKSLSGLILLLAIISIPEKLYADILHLKTGGTIDGGIIEETDTYVRIKTDPGIEFTVEKNKIESVEKKETAEDVYLKRLKDLKDDDAKGHYELALWCENKKLNQHAKKEFQKAIEVNHTYKEARIELAKMLIEEGNIYEAIEHMDELNKNYLEDIEVKDWLSRTLKKWPKVEYYMKAKNISDKDAEGHYQMGIFCSDKGWLQEAREEWRKAVEISSSYNEKINKHILLLQQSEAKMLFETGISEFNAQRYEKSVSLFQKVIQEYGKTDIAKDAQKMLAEAEGKRDEERKAKEEQKRQEARKRGVAGKYGYKWEWGTSMEKIREDIKYKNPQLVSDGILEYQDVIMNKSCAIRLEFTLRYLLYKVVIKWNTSVGDNIRDFLTEQYGSPTGYRDSGQYSWGNSDKETSDIILLDYSFFSTTLTYFSGEYNKKYIEELDRVIEQIDRW